MQAVAFASPTPSTPRSTLDDMLTLHKTKHSHAMATIQGAINTTSIMIIGREALYDKSTPL